jgi:hypothetical protein
MYTFWFKSVLVAHTFVSCFHRVVAVATMYNVHAYYARVTAEAINFDLNIIEM